MRTPYFIPALLTLSYLSSSVFAQSNTNKLSVANTPTVEEVHIWGAAREGSDLPYSNPTSVLTQEDMIAINAVTTEDLVKFEPSLVVRRRFIGDANGTLGIRGSNMFQTARSMVFADGVPLHYLLQSRWSGAPRWTMVSASEIAQVDVIYGPFSAEYSGNAMGGVVVIETAIPQEREVHIDASYFSQEFAAYGFDDTVDGFKGFMSYGDKIGDASIYLSYNHLNSTAQPQTFRDSAYISSAENDTVSGSELGNNSKGASRLWYGDTGVVDTSTDNLKFKLGYDFGDWQSLLNVAHESRESANVGQSYITDNNGNVVWSGNALVEDGREFSINSGRINANELNRESLSLGLRLLGQLSDDTQLEANINQFDILNDEGRSSLLNPNDPSYTSTGEITDYHNSGWQTADVKLVMSDVATEGLQIITGLRYEAYELNLDVYSSPDYAAGIKGDYTSRFGGQTEIAAAFVQANWQITAQWDVELGLRYELFESLNGYYSDDDAATSEFDLVQIPSSSTDAFSPKFSLGYRPQDDWLVRYSAAKAYRFPIVEELFSQYEAYNTVALSNPDLGPEEGLHHNIMIDKTVQGGYLRVNFFQETVHDAIESQTDTSTNVRSFVPIDETFVPIDETEAKGIEFIANISGIALDALDLRFNLTWTDAKIVDNSSAESGADFDPTNSIAGNVYPRMPKWRSNLLATYHLHDDWNVSANLQYASDSFGSLDNSDTETNVYGAQDAYTRVGLKTAYQLTEQWNVSLGVDNVTNEIDYVAHPWPGRTVYLNVAFDL